MDRLEFSQSIDIDPVIQVTSFFNEVMAMYDLIKEYDYISIHGLIDNGKEILFTVTFSSPDKARTVCDKINNEGNIVIVYGYMYTISGEINNSNVDIRVLKLGESNNIITNI